MVFDQILDWIDKWSLGFSLHISPCPAVALDVPVSVAVEGTRSGTADRRRIEIRGLCARVRVGGLGNYTQLSRLLWLVITNTACYDCLAAYY